MRLLLAALLLGLASTLIVTPALAAESINEPLGEPGYLPLGEDGQPLNLDFEKGDLSDWTATGDAFDKQPHQGPISPNRPFGGDKTSDHTGQFWLGGFEFLGDQPQGTLESRPFVIDAPFASFLIAGGSHQGTRVELVEVGQEKPLYRVSGDNRENLRPVVLDLQPHQGKKVFVRIVDEVSGGWGHVNFDDFRFHKARPKFQSQEVSLLPVPDADDLYPFHGLTAEEAAREMRLPPGFGVQVAAAEPDVRQPIAMAFDHRGRLWVAEGFTYPQRAAEGEGQDRILIFEDTNLDGTLDKRTVFAENLNLVSGLEVGFGGVWVGAAPYLLFIPDADQDDVPDGEPQVLLDGWGYQDTHETLNTFIWGPDGWLYGCHGVFTHSNVGKPGTPDNQRTRINAGIWRYHPTRHEFEVFAHGTSNPWGVDFNDQGQAFLTCCVIPHLFHVVQGARYHRQAGQHFNPHTYDDIKTIAVHRHFQGNQWNTDDQLRSDSIGGGHAHAGAMVYLGGSWPAEYRNQIFMNNIHGARINMDRLSRRGSGYEGNAAPDFLFARDVASQILNLRYGPDGQVWMIDWYDTNQCHRVEIELHDRSNGRIFRVFYNDAKPVKVDLREKSNGELVELTRHPNDWYVRHARRLLQERAAAGEVADEIKTALVELLQSDASQNVRLRALWALHVIGGLDRDLAVSLLEDPEEFVRAWVVQLVLEENGLPDGAFLQKLEQMAQRDPSQLVRLYLASAAQKIAPQQRWQLVTNLISHSADSHDHNLPLMYWYALEPLAEVDPQRALAIGLIAGEHHPRLQQFMVRRIGSQGQGEALSLLTSGLAEAEDDNSRLIFLQGINQALKGRRQAEPPPGWKQIAPKLLGSPDRSVRRQAVLLAATLQDQNVIADLQEVLREQSSDTDQARFALQVLDKVRPAHYVDDLLAAFKRPAIREEVILALGGLDDPRVPQLLLTAYSSLTGEEKERALATLTARPAYATQLVDALEQGTVPKQAITAETARQIMLLDQEDLTQRLEKVWGTLRQSPAEAKRLMAEYQAMITASGVPAPDLAAGRAVFAKTCAQCHRLFGTGGDIGPELTGSNRAELDYLLSNMVDPSSVMAKEYQPWVVLTIEGRVITGLIKEEDDHSITLQTAQELVILPRDEIEAIRQSDKSMMPDNLLQSLQPGEIRNLVAYLASPQQTLLELTEQTAGELFNGIDLTNWRGNRSLWTVEEGQIVGRSGGLSRNEFLISDLQASDFHLTLEVKLVNNQGNSGIQFRSQPIEGGSVKGYQADIGPGWWGKLYEEHGRALLWDKSGEHLIKPGDWNTYEIIARGEHVQTKINGTVSVDLRDGEGDRRGIFALQLHSGGPMEIRFRNLKLVPLTADGKSDTEISPSP